MNEPQREGSAENLEEVEQEKLQDQTILFHDSIDNFTCHVAPGNTKVTWIAHYSSSGGLVNVVCWDTSNYDVNATAINLSRFEWVNGIKTSLPLLQNVSGYNPPYVDRHIDTNYLYQYEVDLIHPHFVLGQTVVITSSPPSKPVPGKGG